MTGGTYQFNKHARVGSSAGPETNEAAPKADSL